MDGNRRWARSKGFSTLKGHRKGYDKVKEIGELCLKKGIKILTVYAFSTENWHRSKKEVRYLMKLLKNAMINEIEYFKKQNIRVRIIGRISDLSLDMQKSIKKMEQATKNGKKGFLNIAISYGGRTEIVNAIKKIIKEKIPLDKITEEIVNNKLYTAGLPDPDLIVRTSGEQRLSGFLLWQSSYSELYFPDVYWPDFSEDDLDKALNWFKNRKRRFGGDTNK